MPDVRRCFKPYRNLIDNVLLEGSVMGVEVLSFPSVTALFKLASSDLIPSAFKTECETFARFDEKTSTSELWRFHVDAGEILIVALEAEKGLRSKPNGWPVRTPIKVSCAVLSICWWDAFIESEHDNSRSWQRERNEFDRCYADSLSEAVRCLGVPLLQGVDSDENRHRYAIWRGKTCLFILQQSAYDPQFGHDINYWIQPWSGPDPEPSSPFIDWLQRLVAPPERW